MLYLKSYKLFESIGDNIDDLMKHRYQNSELVIE